MEVTSETLNLRSAPGLNSQVILVMQRGAIVEEISGPTVMDGFHWLLVSFHGQQGFAASEFLSASGGEGQCSSDCQLTPGGFARVNADFLNLRCGPSIDCDIIMSVPEGTVVKLLDGPTEADGFHWWHVSFDDHEGFMAGEFLEAVSGPGPSPQPCDSGCDMHKGDDAVVTSDTLNLRSGPGLNCPVIDVMSKGDHVEVLDDPIQADGFHWFKVSFNGEVGFAAGEFLKASGNQNGCPTNCGQLHPDEDAWVRNTPFLHLRNGAGLSCDIMASIPDGTKVHVMDGPTHVDDFDWWHISYTDSSGHNWDGYAAGDWLDTSASANASSN
jgi:N-acetylmuramoyl-L-alanine amidase